MKYHNKIDNKNNVVKNSLMDEENNSKILTKNISNKSNNLKQNQQVRSWGIAIHKEN